MNSYISPKTFKFVTKRFVTFHWLRRLKHQAILFLIVVLSLLRVKPSVLFRTYD